jgi:hypothetical protein
MDLIDRKAVLEILLLWEVDYRVEKAIMAIPVYDGGMLKAVPDFSEDRSAIQGTNPRLAELIKERQETLTREEKAKIVGAWHDYHGA